MRHQPAPRSEGLGWVGFGGTRGGGRDGVWWRKNGFLWKTRFFFSRDPLVCSMLVDRRVNGFSSLVGTVLWSWWTSDALVEYPPIHVAMEPD